MRFRKKPVEVEAIQWTGKNMGAVKAWIREQVAGRPDIAPALPIAYFVARRQTDMSETLWTNIATADWGRDITAAIYDYLHQTYVGVKDGQWIICGIKGEFYPCDEETFLGTYEPARTEPPLPTLYGGPSTGVPE